MIAKDEEYRVPPRVNQLDALALDAEIFNIFKNGIQSALKQFVR